MSFSIRYLLCGAALAVLPVDAFGAAIDKLVAHRAVYDVKLKDSSERSGITGMNGRIVYEVTGSKCEGFAVKFRFFTNVRTDTKEYTTDQRTTSFEDAAGQNYQFATKSYFNGALENEIRGKALLTPENTLVNLTRPEERQVSLPPAMFMTQHTVKILEAAEAGETVYSTDVYDGSDPGDELMQTTAIIGKKRLDIELGEDESKEAAAKFAGTAWWPVSISYFASNEDKSGEKLPQYQVSFAMHENGISRDLIMRYEDYELEGALRDVEFLDTEPCNGK